MARRAAAGEPPLTAHLTDAAPLVRHAAEEARRSVAAARGGGGAPPVAVLGRGGALTAPEPLCRALTSLLTGVLERGAPVEVELSTGGGMLGLRLAATAPPHRRWSGTTRAASRSTPHAARDHSSWDGDGGCWDADAIRLVEQLGGSVEMVTTPGLLAEAFVTLPRAGAGH